MTKSLDQLRQVAASRLGSVLRNNVVLPDDAAYAAARRVWNREMDFRPAMIVYCESVGDVQAALRAARESNLAISVRGGGYDIESRSVRPDALVIDLSRMNRVEVKDGMAKVAGGARVSAVISAAAASGLMPVTGWHGVMGMAGLLLTGGYGPLIASQGLALDSLVSAEMILADGRVVGVDADQNPDLLWALQGAGTNFGVVTAMNIRLHPQRQLIGGMILFPWSDAERVLGSYAATASSAGNDLTVLAAIICLPEGRPALFLAPSWTGEPARGEAVIASLQELGNPFHVQVGSLNYQDLIRSFDEHLVDDRHVAVQTRWVPALTPKVISTLVEFGDKFSSPFSTIVLQHFRGAAAQIPVESTAFGLRQEHFLIEIVAMWEDSEGKKHRAWAQNVSNALAGESLPGGYTTLLGRAEHDRIALAYGGNLAKLRDVKQHFDPQDVFSATPLLG